MKNGIALISNIVFEPYWSKFMANAFAPYDSDVRIVCVPYEELNKKMTKFDDLAIVVVCLNFDVLYPDAVNNVASGNVLLDNIICDAICKCNRLYLQIKASCKSKIVWFDFEDYCYNHDIICGTVGVLNDAIYKINSSISDMLRQDCTTCRAGTMMHRCRGLSVRMRGYT